LNPNYLAGWHGTNPFEQVSPPAVISVLAFAVKSWAGVVAGAVWTATGVMADFDPLRGFT